MIEYQIIIEAVAEKDIDEILIYIQEVLHESTAAKNWYLKMKEAVLSLATMPERDPLIKEESYQMIGIRRIQIDHYTGFYQVCKETKIVRILRILYNRREWKRIL